MSKDLMELRLTQHGCTLLDPAGDVELTGRTICRSVLLTDMQAHAQVPGQVTLPIRQKDLQLWLQHVQGHAHYSQRNTRDLCDLVKVSLSPKANTTTALMFGKESYNRPSLILCRQQTCSLMNAQHKMSACVSSPVSVEL